MKRFLCIVLVALISGGCVTNTKKSSNSFMITIFSPVVKINDVGFLHKSENFVNLQIYSSGVNTLNLKISDKICINRACYAKTEFNDKFFGAAHYDDFFKEILNKKPIYEGRNLIRSECGFSQTINDVNYEVCGGNVKFNDRKNRIKFIMKELI